MSWPSVLLNLRASLNQAAGGLLQASALQAMLTPQQEARAADGLEEAKVDSAFLLTDGPGQRVRPGPWNWHVCPARRQAAPSMVSGSWWHWAWWLGSCLKASPPITAPILYPSTPAPPPSWQAQASVLLGPTGWAA